MNYFCGMTPVPFVAYAAATLVGTIPVTSIYVYLGYMGHAAAGSTMGWPHWALFELGLAATDVATILVTRRVRHNFDETRRTDGLGATRSWSVQTHDFRTKRPTQAASCLAGEIQSWEPSVSPRCRRSWTVTGAAVESPTIDLDEKARDGEISAGLVRPEAGPVASLDLDCITHRDAEGPYSRESATGAC
jgi:hypothetical protein